MGASTLRSVAAVHAHQLRYTATDISAPSYRAQQSVGVHHLDTRKAPQQLALALSGQSELCNMRGAAWALCTAHVATALLAPPSPAPKLTQRKAVLTVGTPLNWPDALDRLGYVREHGIDQFIEMWRRSQTLKRDDDLLWGDEVEYAVLRVDEHQAKISLRAVHKMKLSRRASIMTSTPSTRRQLDGVPLGVRLTG